MTPEQERLFAMLKELVALCDEHGLAYYVAGGTTLGAVRHAGFIPWDDDVDIMMPYDDWRALVEIARNGGLPENRVLNCLELDDDYLHVFGRYTDTTSCAIHYNQLLGGSPEGFIIDIFILDPVPDAGEGFASHRELLSLYNDLANDFGYSYPFTQDKELLKRYSRRAKREGKRAVLEELDAQLSCHERESCDYLVMRWAAAPRLFKKDIFAFDRFERFEGIDVSVPGKCNDYLVQHYGDDWMYVPADSGRITHDAITFLDVDYKTVQDDYLPFVDKKRARRAFLNRRAYHIERMEDLRKVNDLSAGVYATFARLETLKRVQACDVDLWEMLDSPDHEVLDWVFGEFYRWQNSPELAGREEYLTINRYYDPVYVDIGDDLLAVAVLNLVDTNRMGQAGRILRVRERAGGPFSPLLRAARDLLDAVRLTSSLYDIGLEREAFELASYLLEKRPGNFSNRVFLAQRLLEAARFDELASVASEGLELFPESGEFEKYLADCRYESAVADGEKRLAFEAYASALERTTQSAIADDIKRKAAEECGAIGEQLAHRLDEAAANAAQMVPASAKAHDAAAIGRKTVQLLAELHDICSRNGIDHVLGCTSCRLALVYGDNRPGMPELDLYVPAGRFADLAMAVECEMGEGRALDYWGTNGNHLDYRIDYVDTTTTYLQLDEGFNVKAPGVKVAIYPIRHRVGGIKGSALEALEIGWENNGYALTKNITAKGLASAGVARAGMALGRKRLGKRLFKTFNAEYGKGAGAGKPDGAVRLSQGKTLECDARLLQEAETVEFGGFGLPVPKDARAVMHGWLGPDWEAETLRMKPNLKNVVLSADMPYETFICELEQEGCPIGALFSLMKRIRLSMLPLAYDLRTRNRVMTLAARSEDRKRAYDYLHEHDDEIRRLLADGDYGALARIFAAYDQKARYYLKKGLGLCPSKRYLTVLCGLWRRNGEGDKADKLEKLAPSQHFRPL